MADDANYRDLMAQLAASFAPNGDMRGLSEGKVEINRPIDAASRMMAGSGVEQGQYSGSVGMRGDQGSVMGRISSDEAGMPAGYGFGVNAGPVGYQQSRPMQRGAPAQHSFNLNLDPDDVGARLQAILNQGAGGQRSYGVGTGGEGWGAQAVYDPHRRALQISGGMQRQFARGGSVRGYATGGPADDPIEALYNKYTGHGSDAAGKAWWQQQTAGMSPEEQDAAFLKGANQAYAANATATGPVSDAQIQNLYQQYAGRAADQGGLDYWKQKAAAPGATYADLSNQFRQDVSNAGSPEQVQTVKAPAWLEKFDYENFDNPLDAGLDYLKRTLGDKAAAALYGQFPTESYGNPQQLQIDKNGQPLIYSKGKFAGMPMGMGLAQWSPQRQNDLYQFADKYGVDPNSTEGQLRFAVHNLTNEPYYSKWLDRVQNPNVNVAGATQILGKNYESPKKLSLTIAKRQADADMLSRYMSKGTLTPDEQAKIASMKSGMQDPLFASKMAAKQDLIAKNAAAEKAKLAGTADILPDTGFNPVVDTSVNDRIMQQSNDYLNQSLQNNLNSGTNFVDPNNLNTGMGTYNTDMSFSSGNSAQGRGINGFGELNGLVIPGPGNSDQQNGISLMPGFEPFARGGRVMGYAEGGSFQPMFEGDSEMLQMRAKQLAKQAYSDPRSLSPQDMKEWNLLAGRYNLPFSAQNPMSYEDETEQRNSALERNMSAKERQRTYARGGAVDAYDPAEIDAIAAQIRGAA